MLKGSALSKAQREKRASLGFHQVKIDIWRKKQKGQVFIDM